MNILRNRGLGDLVYVDVIHDGHHGHHTLKLDLEYWLVRFKKMSQIDKITDLAGLPEYLSDEDPGVVAVAKAKLEELSP